MVAPGCTKHVPRSGSIRPAAILSKVDLPDPLRPTRQTRSPAETLNSTPSSSGVPPKVSAMSLSWMRGATIVLCDSAALRALQAANGLVERGQEGGAVARRERSRPARDLAGGAKVVHQVAHRQRHADRRLGERLAARRDHLRARLDAATRERDVGRDHDVVRAGMLRD